MALDTSRSTALSWEFPPPRWAQGLSTGATNSEWKRQWRHLHHWRTEEIDNYQSIGNLFRNMIRHIGYLEFNATRPRQLPQFTPYLLRGNACQGIFRLRGCSQPPGCCFQW